jgi:hypothetical protein
MALNLNTLEIFKKAFEQFQSSNNHFSNLQNQTANTVTNGASSNAQPPSSSFSVSKILQTNNEVLNKPPVVENSNGNNLEAKKETVGCQSLMKDENKKEVSLVRICKKKKLLNYLKLTKRL